jgi:hypothetical protein
LRCCAATKKEAKSEAETTANSGVVWDSRGEAGDKRRANEGAKRTLSLSLSLSLSQITLLLTGGLV